MRVLEGHEELVRCIRFDSKRIVSGAYDGCVLNSLHALLAPVNTLIQALFITNFSVAAYSKIKVWDLEAAMDPRSPPGTLCIRTLVVSDLKKCLLVHLRRTHTYCSSFSRLQQEHSGRVFRLQFDEFQIVSSSHDDTILIWDFLNVPQSEERNSQRTYTYVTR